MSEDVPLIKGAVVSVTGGIKKRKDRRKTKKEKRKEGKNKKG